MTDKKAEYMAKFRTFSVEKKRRHLTIGLRWLLQLLQREAASRK